MNQSPAKNLSSADGIAIAVLPFGNLSGDPGRDFFSLGITEEVLTSLSRLPGLRVTARTSSFSLQGQQLTAQEIGTLLGVQYLLEGSVRQAGERVRITTRLIEAETGFEVFTETFQGESEDVFDLQDSIAASIAERMLHNLPASGGLAPHGEISGPAYESFLEGRFLFNQGNPESVQKAVRKFELATEASPEFPQAWSALSEAYLFLLVREILPPARAALQARHFAENALRLSPDLPDAWLALGLVNLYTWEWKAARDAFRKALELAPGMAGTHRQYARYLGITGRYEQALAELDLALRLDPLSLDIQNARIDALQLSGKYEEAIREGEKILKKHPEYRSTLNNVGSAHFQLGNFEEAIRIFEHVRERTGDPRKAVTQLGMTYAVAGRKADAERMLTLLEERAGETRRDRLALDFAGLLLALGRKEQALHHIEIAYEHRHPALPYLMHHWYLKDLNSEPRYQEIFQKTGLLGHGTEERQQGEVLTLKSETKEFLRVGAQGLIAFAADDNYTEVIWAEGDQVKRQLLRMTLKKLEEQLPEERFFRAHRSFVISLQHPFTFRGGLKNGKLCSPLLKEEIPVSRSKAKELAALFR